MGPRYRSLSVKLQLEAIYTPSLVNAGLEKWWWEGGAGYSYTL